MPCDVIFKIIGDTCRYPSTRAIAAGAAVGAAVGSSRRAPGPDSPRLATALARHPSSSRHPSERAKLNHVLHVRDLSEKKEGIHVLRHAMAASSAMGRFRG